ncbi:SIS domain-containing protein [Alphaproteobacteria bacterium]|nr:SIS domain-containing protein [Alphaproteobacteria bacterium]
MKNKYLSLDVNQLLTIKNLFIDVKNNNSKIIIVGNGGSAAIASHVSIDLTKTLNIRSITFNESSLITCLANDYGYENWVSQALSNYATDKDLIVLISSSGQSLNMINAANKAKKLNLNLLTLTGFDKNNPLSLLGDINLWVDSKNYNIVENVHQITLLSILDLIIIDT